MRSSFITTFAASALTFCLATNDAHADDDKRPKQDYGHPAPKTDAGDVLAWPARVVLFPLWLISEGLLRQPIGAGARAIERNNVVDTLEDFFTFGPHDNVTLYPSALFDFGLLPSVGANLAWTELGSKKNTLRAHVGFWGPDWVVLSGTDTYDRTPKEHLHFSASVTRRRDIPFYGIGPRSAQNARVRYAAQTFEIAPGYTHDFWRSSNITTSAGFRGLDYFDGTCCGDNSLRDEIRNGTRVAPQGYDDPYYGGFQRIAISIDSRRPRPAPGTGVRIEAHEETMFDLARTGGGTPSSWIRWGGSAGVAVDLTGTQRVLALSIDAELAEAMQGKMPFTELVALGGDTLMPGYIRNRLLGQSALVATMQYTWPIWVFLDGVATVSAGNVYGERFANFTVDKSRLNAGIGVRSNGDRASGFEILVGGGTDPLDEGFKVSSFRFLVGSHHGF